MIELEFTVNRTDLGPVGLVPFLGVVAPMNAFLAATPSPKSASWALSDQSDHTYTIERISSGRVRLSASWSGLEATCFEGPLRAAWGCFSQRILRVLGARDRSIEHNVIVKRMLHAVLDNQSRQSDADARLIMLRGLEPRRDRESIQSAADLVARVAWGIPERSAPVRGLRALNSPDP